MKKGGINLSINMIIVLIIAIVVLGFALSFITGMFGDTEDKIREGLEGIETPEVPVDRQSPIGIGESLIIDSGEEKSIGLRVLNTLGTDVTVNAGEINCQKGGNTYDSTSPQGLSLSTVLPTDIAAGNVGDVKVVIQAGGNLVNNAICTISLYNQGNPSQRITDSFFVRVD